MGVWGGRDEGGGGGGRPIFSHVVVREPPSKSLSASLGFSKRSCRKS